MVLGDLMKATNLHSSFGGASSKSTSELIQSCLFVCFKKIKMNFHNLFAFFK